jgi:hypothetical protein
MASRARLAAIFATAAVAVGGTAAAYADVLPGPVQEFAHRLIDAPPASHGAAHSPSGSQSSGGQRGGVSSPSATQNHQQASHGIAKGHGNRTLHPSSKGQASKHRPRKHRAHRHVPKGRPTPTPTPTLTPTPSPTPTR